VRRLVARRGAVRDIDVTLHAHTEPGFRITPAASPTPAILDLAQVAQRTAGTSALKCRPRPGPPPRPPAAWC
jgi:hypothetical protein